MHHYRDHPHHRDLAAVAPCLPPEIPVDDRGLPQPKTPTRADVVETVSRAIKRQGVFDRERRKVMERLKNEGSLQQLETEAKASFEKLLATQSADITRTQLHQLLRDQLRLGKLPVEIRQLAEKSCADPTVREEIRAEVTPRVRESLALPRVGEEVEKKEEHKKEEKQTGGEKENGAEKQTGGEKENGGGEKENGAEKQRGGEQQTGGEKENGGGEKQTGGEKENGAEKQTEHQKPFAVTAVIEKIPVVTILARGSVSPVRDGEEKDGKDEREEKQRGGEKENGAKDITGEGLKLAEKSFAAMRVREGRRAEVTPRIREARERGEKHRRGEERSIGRQERDEKQRRGEERSIGRQERDEKQRRVEERSIGRQERDEKQRRGEERSIGRQKREEKQRRGEDRSIGRQERDEKQRRGEYRSIGRQEREEKQRDRDEKREKKEGIQRGLGGEETKNSWLELKRARLKSPTRLHEMEWI